jgi:hypothetical protein
MFSGRLIVNIKVTTFCKQKLNNHKISAHSIPSGNLDFLGSYYNLQIITNSIQLAYFSLSLSQSKINLILPTLDSNGCLAILEHFTGCLFLQLKEYIIILQKKDDNQIR